MFLSAECFIYEIFKFIKMKIFLIYVLLQLQVYLQFCVYILSLATCRTHITNSATLNTMHTINNRRIGKQILSQVASRYVMNHVYDTSVRTKFRICRASLSVYSNVNDHGHMLNMINTTIIYKRSQDATGRIYFYHG